MEDQENKQEVISRQEEMIEISKNSKGYNWRVKVFIENKQDDKALKRIKDIDDKLQKEYNLNKEVGDEKG